MFVITIRVIYERVQNRKKCFEIGAFLNLIQEIQIKKPSQSLKHKERNLNKIFPVPYPIIYTSR